MLARLEETAAGAACGVFTEWLFLGARIAGPGRTDPGPARGRAAGDTLETDR